VSNSLVSVIIPTYNRAEIIGKAVQSALDQDYVNKEIIVVDDGSTDDTVRQVRKFAGVQVITQPNQGAGAARNRGLSAAGGEFIATLDSDDYWESGYLSYGLQAMQRSKAGIFFANWKETAADGTVDCPDYMAKATLTRPYLSRADAHGNIVLTAEECRRLFLNGLAAPSSGLILRRELLSHGWEHLTIGEDWLMVLKAVLRQPTTCAFTTRKLWTKTRDGKNVYDLAAATPALRHTLAADTEVIGQRVVDLLTVKEKKQFRALVAELYFDYAYSISATEPRRALSCYRHSNKLAFRSKTCAAIGKTLLKAIALKTAI
jgi:glycosyltransferase involved in cell wall biosynthesis